MELKIICMQKISQALSMGSWFNLIDLGPSSLLLWLLLVHRSLKFLQRWAALTFAWSGFWGVFCSVLTPLSAFVSCCHSAPRRRLSPCSWPTPAEDLYLPLLATRLIAGILGPPDLDLGHWAFFGVPATSSPWQPDSDLCPCSGDGVSRGLSGRVSCPLLSDRRCLLCNSAESWTPEGFTPFGHHGRPFLWYERVSQTSVVFHFCMPATAGPRTSASLRASPALRLLPRPQALFWASTETSRSLVSVAPSYSKLSYESMFHVWEFIKMLAVFFSSPFRVATSSHVLTKVNMCFFSLWRDLSLLEFSLPGCFVT